MECLQGRHLNALSNQSKITLHFNIFETEFGLGIKICFLFMRHLTEDPGCLVAIDTLPSLVSKYLGKKIYIFI